MNDTQTTLDLELPWPPSVNDYWLKRVQYKGNRCKSCRRGKAAYVQLTLTDRAEQYREAINVIVSKQVEDWTMLPLSGNLFVSCTLHPPDKRIRDEDNLFKALWDSLTAANVWEDDSQVRSKFLRHGELDRPKGRVDLYIRQMADGEHVTLRDLR